LFLAQRFSALGMDKMKPDGLVPASPDGRVEADA